MKIVLLLVGLILSVPEIEATTDGSYELIETTDLEKIFNTNDPEELRLAQASLIANGLTDNSTDYYDVASYAGVLTCVRKIIEEGRGGLQGTRVAAQLLKELTNVMFLQQRGSPLRLRCEKYAGSTDSEGVDRDEQAQFITHLDDYDSRVKTMLYRYIKPTTTCFQVGGRVDVGLVAVVGGDVGLEYCYANNGRHWLQMALGGRGGYGAGALAMLKIGNYRYRMNHLGGPFTYTKTRDSTWALGFGMSQTDYGENYAHSTRGILFVIPSRQSKSLGAGIAYTKSWGRRAGLKFLPLGTSDQKLVDEYASLSDNDLIAEQGTLSKELRSMGKAVLRVNIDNSQQVTFILCDADGNQCRDLAAGSSFPLSLLKENMETLKLTYQEAQDRAFEAKLRKIAGAGAALTVAAPMTIRTLLEQYSTEDGIPLKQLVKERHQQGARLPYGFKIDDAGELVPDNTRGLKFGNDKLNQLLEKPQKVLDSSFSRKLHEIADRFLHGYNHGLFKNSRARYIIPAVALVGGGFVALFASLDEHKNKQIVAKLKEIEDQRQELARILAEPNSQMVIYDQRLMIETLKYLIN